MTIKLYDIVHRQYTSYRGRSILNVGVVVNVTDDTICAVFSQLYAEFDRQTGINLRGKEHGWLVEIAGEDFDKVSSDC